MCTVTTVSGMAEAYTLALSGKIAADSLPEIDRLLRKARHACRIVLDLGEVTLLDRAAAHFLAEKAHRGVELVNCPAYIEPWIFRAGMSATVSPSEANHECEANHK